MTDVLIFVLGALALLATPGPTNTLLATSGATRGMRPSLPLLRGETAGHLSAILILRLLVGPVVAREPLIGSILSGWVCLYELFAAATRE